MDKDGQSEEIHPSDGDSVEYFFASDASAIIEHTNRVIFLEDSDVASVKGGVLTIHNLDEDMVKETGGAREVTVLKMEIQEIMKVSFTVILTNLTNMATERLKCHYIFLREVSRASCRRKSLNSQSLW